MASRTGFQAAWTRVPSKRCARRLLDGVVRDARKRRGSAPELRGERHGAGAAAGAAHGNEDVLLLLLVEVGTVEHLPRLLLEQFVQRERAVGNLLLRRGVGSRRR